jgi:hypothetical protein
VSAFIPVGYGYDMIPNAMDVRSKEEADMDLQFSDYVANTAFASGATWEVYGVVEPALPERYELHVSQQDISANSANRVDETLDQRNVGAALLEDPSDVVNEVGYEQDGRTLPNDIDLEAINDFTDWQNQVESSISRVEAFDADGLFSNTLNEVTEITVNFSGAGTLSQYVLHTVQHDQQFLEDSRQRAANFRASR